MNARRSKEAVDIDILLFAPGRRCAFAGPRSAAHVADVQ